MEFNKLFFTFIVIIYFIIYRFYFILLFVGYISMKLIFIIDICLWHSKMNNKIITYFYLLTDEVIKKEVKKKKKDNPNKNSCR